MTIENEIESLKGFPKPLPNAGYDEIAKTVNEELAALGYDGLHDWRSIKICFHRSRVTVRNLIGMNLMDFE